MRVGGGTRHLRTVPQPRYLFKARCVFCVRIEYAELECGGEGRKTSYETCGKAQVMLATIAQASPRFHKRPWFHEAATAW